MLNIFGKKTHERKIGIWGLTGAGKTTYLAALWLAVNNTPSTEWRILAKNETAKTLFINYSGDLSNGIFPPATDPDTNPVQYDFMLEYKSYRGRSQRYNLSLIDAAGQHVLDDNDKYGYFETLQQSSGLILMIDPNPIVEEQKKQGYFKPITRLLSKLDNCRNNNSGKIETNIALCATKCDMGKWPNIAGNPQGIFREIMDHFTYNAIKTSFSSVCEFAISSVGLLKTPTGEIISNMDFIIEDNQQRLKIRDMKHWEPMCLLEPIIWLTDPKNNNCGC